MFKRKEEINEFFFPPDKFMKHYSGLAESAKNIVMRPITVQAKKESNKGNSGGKLEQRGITGTKFNNNLEVLN